jgi:branched-chain amino acid aminotransferase
MLKVEWTKSGWDKPVICPLSNLSVHPAAKVFHYGIEVSLIRIAKEEYYGEEF